MNNLESALAEGKFVVTCELSPPKGTDLSTLIEKALSLKDSVTAFNLTDSAAARMTLDPMVAGYELIKQGVEPIVQVTSRDKNRLAIQSGMLGADVLGIPNLVIMGGDPPFIGDHPEAKGVNDLFANQIIEAAVALNSGTDHMGNALNKPTDMFVGSVFNPGADDMNAEIENTIRKIDAGAEFFQTQAVFEIDQYLEFMDKLNQPNIKVLTGIIPIKSTKMASYMNERVPGINIPGHLMQRIAEAEKTDSVVNESLSIASDMIKELRDQTDGVHVMAIGWEKHVNDLLARADIN